MEKKKEIGRNPLPQVGPSQEELNKVYRDKWVNAIMDCMKKPDHDYKKALGDIVDHIYSDGYSDSEDENVDADSIREGMAATREWERDSRD